MADQEPGSDAIEHRPEPDVTPPSQHADSGSGQLPPAENGGLSALEVRQLPDPAPLLIRGDSSTSRSAATKFLESLPVVKREILPDDYQTCHICKEDFVDDSNPTVAVKAESPLKLPCGHIFGSECLAKWFLQKNTCPICRTTHFRDIAHPEMPLRAQLAQLGLWAGESRLPERNVELRALLTDIATLNTRYSVRLLEIQSSQMTEEERMVEVSMLGRRMRAIDDMLDQIENGLREMGA
ncbi:hypothetical protein IMSHALPRED_007017 [Imshaugia aleurites]|uniref:RING-type domain-containing protein n=1 Tax=Imshaugia aleurites TaxID=172621 RepID=A0A8H3FLD2_9LECA|nr:hypothetical protein IMSHALPRED_007017 [Imshaugia aleurites]